MKFLVILFIILIVAALFAARYRLQIGNILHLWRVLKKMNQDAGREQSRFPEPGASGDVRLIKCSGCETWTPQENSFEVRQGVYYCSADCLAKSAKTV